MRVPRGARPNLDDNDDDDDIASAEAGHPDDPNPDGPSTPAPSSSSQPEADNTSVPAAAAARARTPNPKVPFSISLTLRNTGSVARDHLASERTFLAYVRTSLSFASAGVGPSHPSFPTSSTSLKNFIHDYSPCTVVSRLRERERVLARPARSLFLCTAFGHDADCVWDGGVSHG
jgi:Domain of unknown function (DUF202)